MRIQNTIFDLARDAYVFAYFFFTGLLLELKAKPSHSTLQNRRLARFFLLNKYEYGFETMLKECSDLPVGLECCLEELDALVVTDKHESAANAAKNVREVALNKMIDYYLQKLMPKNMTFPTTSTTE